MRFRDVDRQKTAIRRYKYSRPVSCALCDGIIDQTKTFFDYGCGHGEDVALLRNAGIQSSGWDPSHKSSTTPVPADIVNLGYVVNVIDPNQDLWVNVWMDFNRDGDWDDDTSTDPEMGDGQRYVTEWAVQNQLLFGLPAGLNRISAPAFMAWHPEKGPEAIWMRITLSEIPFRGGDNPGVTGNAGSGPAEGFAIGETEDYFFVPETECLLCEDLNGDGEIDFDALIELMYKWLDTCQK